LPISILGPGSITLIYRFAEATRDADHAHAATSTGRLIAALFAG
jgi:hypothetical protein